MELLSIQYFGFTYFQVYHPKRNFNEKKSRLRSEMRKMNRIIFTETNVWFLFII